MENIINAVKERPWLVAVAVVVLLLLLRMGGSKQQASGPDYSATLASLDITSRTNVAMAELGVQRDKIAMDGNTAAQQAMAAISLGAMDYAKVDRQSSMVERVQNIAATNTLLSGVSNAAIAAFQSTLGQTLAAKSLDNEAYRLATDRGVQHRAIDSNELIQLTDIGTQAALTRDSFALEKQMNDANNALADKLGTLDFNSLVASLGSSERMQAAQNQTDIVLNDRKMANLENLYWRQKQIAKSGFLMDFLKQNVISIGNYAESTSKFW